MLLTFVCQARARARARATARHKEVITIKPYGNTVKPQDMIKTTINAELLLNSIVVIPSRGKANITPDKAEKCAEYLNGLVNEYTHEYNPNTAKHVGEIGRWAIEESGLKTEEIEKIIDIDGSWFIIIPKAEEENVEETREGFEVVEYEGEKYEIFAKPYDGLTEEEIVEIATKDYEESRVDPATEYLRSMFAFGDETEEEREASIRLRADYIRKVNSMTRNEWIKRQVHGIRCESVGQYAL